MTPNDCSYGRPRRSRQRDRGGRGMGRRGGGGTWRSSSLTRGAAASAAAFVAKDVLERDGVLRPLLRSVAERLQHASSRLLCRVGARYLELDPHPVEVIEPVTSAPRLSTPATGLPPADQIDADATELDDESVLDAASAALESGPAPEEAARTSRPR